jgi:hypothetical protein
MKIIVTERQYKKFIKEDFSSKVESFFEKFLNEVSSKGYLESLDLFFHKYGFDENILFQSKKIYDWFKSNVLPQIRWVNKNRFTEETIKIVNIILETELKKIVNSNIDPERKIISIFNLKDSVDWRMYDTKILKEVTDGLIYDLVNFMFKTYEPKESIRRLSIIKNKLFYDSREEINSLVKGFAEKNGFTLIPKHKGITFQKGDESRIRDLINYIKDVPELPKKTKRGFLNYIDQTESGGQLSTFWSAANQSGIIQKVGGGNTVSYELGPNYKAWEEGKVIAF